MDQNWNEADPVEPEGGLGQDHGSDATDPESESASWMARFANSGPAVDPDRVWLQITTQLDQAESPPRPLVTRAFIGVGRAFQRAARFATITGGGWGGPLVVGLFAILVVAALIAARTSQGHGLS